MTPHPLVAAALYAASQARFNLGGTAAKLKVSAAMKSLPTPAEVDDALSRYGRAVRTGTALAVTEAEAALRAMIPTRSER